MALITLVCIGDSICDGRVTSNQTFTANGRTGRKYTGSGWATLTDPTSYNNSGNGSYWPLVASSLTADGHDVDLVNLGIGSSGLTYGSSLWAKSAATNYSTMQSVLSAAGVTAPSAFIVILGANDSVNPSSFSTATFRTAVNQLVSDLQADYSDAPVIWHQAGEVTTGSPADRRVELDAVREGTRSSNALYGGTMYDIASDDGVHYTTDAHAAKAARRLYLAINEHVLSGATYSGRGPVFSSAVWNADRTTITVRYSAASNLTPASGIQGYRVVDNGSVASPSSVTATGTTNVLTFSPALTGTNTTISLGSQNDGSGVAVPTDSSADNVPAAAFADQAITTPFSGSVFSGVVR